MRQVVLGSLVTCTCSHLYVKIITKLNTQLAWQIHTCRPRWHVAKDMFRHHHHSFILLLLQLLPPWPTISVFIMWGDMFRVRVMTFQGGGFLWGLGFVVGPEFICWDLGTWGTCTAVISLLCFLKCATDHEWILECLLSLPY